MIQTIQCSGFYLSQSDVIIILAILAAFAVGIVATIMQIACWLLLRFRAHTRKIVRRLFVVSVWINLVVAGIALVSTLYVLGDMSNDKDARNGVILAVVYAAFAVGGLLYQKEKI